MADIFKPRKIPKHLTHIYRRKPRHLLWRWVLWFLALLLATGMALEWRYLNSI